MHILHNFSCDFYGKGLSVLVLGFIRDEMRFTSPGECTTRSPFGRGRPAYVFISCEVLLQLWKVLKKHYGLPITCRGVDLIVNGGM